MQYGFRSEHSCTTTLLKVTEDIFTPTDKGKISVLILLDCGKAFDTLALNHKMLVSI